MKTYILVWVSGKHPYQKIAILKIITSGPSIPTKDNRTQRKFKVPISGITTKSLFQSSKNSFNCEIGLTFKKSIPKT